MNLIILICIINQVFGLSLSGITKILNPVAQSKISAAFKNLDSPATFNEISSWPNSMKAGALIRAIDDVNPKAVEAVLSRTQNADLSSVVAKLVQKKDFTLIFKVVQRGDLKTLDSAFNLFPDVISDPKYLDDLFKTLKQNSILPGHDWVAFSSFKKFLIGLPKSEVNPGVLSKTLKVFMDNMQVMNGPAVKAYFSRYPDGVTGILTYARNVRGIKNLPVIVNELDRYLVYFSYFVQRGKVNGNLSVFIQKGVIRMDSPEMNNRIFIEAAKRGDSEFIQYFKSLDPRKFNLEWSNANKILAEYGHPDLMFI